MWHWQTDNGLPYLTCDLLAEWKHGFFTRHFSPRPPAEITPVLDPAAQTYRLKQVHGSTVLTPTEINTTTDIDGETGFARADGALTEATAQAVWVASADCNPILIANRHTGNVAAVHAGWRGTELKIAVHAAKRLLAQGGTVDDIVVAIGPAIAGEVYQVTTGVGLQVAKTITDDRLPADEIEAAQAIQALPNSPLLPDTHPGRVRLDVRRVNQLQLEGIGVDPSKIAVSSHCTYQQPEHFFSYRREKLKQIQWSGIVSNSRSVEP
jgi:polyphenol oxidase